MTSKIHARHHGRHSARTQALMSIGKFDRLDLLLLHHPVCWLPMCDPRKAEGTWLDSWASLEELHLAGKISSIGVTSLLVPVVTLSITMLYGTLVSLTPLLSVTLLCGMLGVARCCPSRCVLSGVQCGGGGLRVATW